MFGTRRQNPPVGGFEQAGISGRDRDRAGLCRRADRATEKAVLQDYCLPG